MLDEKDLQAIAQLMEQQNKLLRQEIQKSVSESESRMMAYFEADIMPKFNLLADAISAVQEKLPDSETMEKMQEELDLHHEMLKIHTHEIKELKKAQ